MPRNNVDTKWRKGGGIGRLGLTHTLLCTKQKTNENPQNSTETQRSAEGYIKHT